VTNLFRTSCTKFYRDQPSFMGDVTKNVLMCYFTAHSVYVETLAVFQAVLWRQE